MRKAYSSQLRLDCQSIEQLKLNLNCRDEIVPILEALKHVFGQFELRDQIIQLVSSDINESTRDDVGREGLDYWQIVVLAVVRLGCSRRRSRREHLVCNSTSSPMASSTCSTATPGSAEAGGANLGSGRSYLLGDANLNGVVDGGDFIIWNANKFTNSDAWSHGDFNADGAVDGADFLVWNSRKFQIADSLFSQSAPRTEEDESDVKLLDSVFDQMFRI